jgi:K+-sensing histidine kinase KdpD
MEMSSQSRDRHLVRLHDVTTNFMAERMMWTFHEQVSHKLRTPLAKLISFLSILRDNRSSFSETDKDSLLAKVDISAQQLKEEILSIFQYIDALDRAEPDQSRYSLSEIPAVIAEINTQLELKPIDIAYENLDNFADTYVLTSRQSMELVLWELIKNAKKFHPEQSPTLEIKISGESTGVRIQISDDGQTLSPEQLTKMWVPYYQAEKYFSGQVPGMGLGLSMVASLIWNIGGTCRAYNQKKGPGVIVELILPVERASW